MTALTRPRTRSTGILIEFIISVPVPTLVKDMVGARSALRFGLFEVFVDDVRGRGQKSLSYIAGD